MREPLQSFNNDDDLPLFMARSWAEASARNSRDARAKRRTFVGVSRAHERMDPVEVGWDDVVRAFSEAWIAESLLIVSASQFEAWLTRLYVARGRDTPQRFPYLRELRNTILHLDESEIDEETWTARPTQRQTKTGVGALPGGELSIWLNGTENLLGVISAEKLERYVRLLLDELSEELDDYAAEWIAELARDR